MQKKPSEVKAQANWIRKNADTLQRVTIYIPKESVSYFINMAREARAEIRKPNPFLESARG